MRIAGVTLDAVKAGDRVAGRYVVERELGRGGVGVVYRALDEKLGTKVALKVVSASGNAYETVKTRLAREARIGGRLGKTHGFVRALDWGELSRSELYLVMDLVVGARALDVTHGELADRLRRVREAASLIAEAHENKVIHRDVKPGNLLVGEDERVYLSDFGLAKVIGEDDTREDDTGRGTQTGTGVGTPVYMPPEQFEDAKHVDERADVYALGVILYEALTKGALPYDGSITAIARKQTRVREGLEPAPRPGDAAEKVSRPLEDLCLRAIELDPEKRLESARSFIERLDAALAVDTKAATVPDMPPRRKKARSSPPPPARRVPHTVVIGAVTGLGILAVAVSRLGRSDGTPASPTEPRPATPVVVAPPAPAPPSPPPVAPPASPPPVPAAERGVIVVRYPAAAPEFAVIGTCPREVLEEVGAYAFAVRRTLVRILESGAAKPLAWPERPCKACFGRHDPDAAACSHCGGTGREPSNIYIASSLEEFAEKTGIRAAENIGAYFLPSANFDFFEEPVVSRVDGPPSDEMLGAVAHETTHQLEHILWGAKDAKPTASDLYTRPVWLTEGLAVFMGDAVDPASRKDGGPLRIRVPRTQLALLRRSLASQRAYPLRQFLSFGIQESQMDPAVLAYAWSFVHFLALSGTTLPCSRGTLESKVVLSRVFEANCKQGDLEQGGRGDLGLARVLGVAGTPSEDDTLAEVERRWRRWVDEARAAPVGVLGPDSVFASSELGIELKLPPGYEIMKDESCMPYASVGFAGGGSSIQIFSVPRADGTAATRAAMLGFYEGAKVKLGPERRVPLASGDASLASFSSGGADGVQGQVLVVEAGRKTFLVVSSERGLLEGIARTLKVAAR